MTFPKISANIKLQNKEYPMNKFEYVDISLIKASDLIEHDNDIRTVTKTNIKGMGKTLFGDSYRLGYKKVKRVILPYITY